MLITSTFLQSYRHSIIFWSYRHSYCYMLIAVTYYCRISSYCHTCQNSYIQLPDLLSYKVFYSFSFLTKKLTRNFLTIKLIYLFIYIFIYLFIYFFLARLETPKVYQNNSKERIPEGWQETCLGFASSRLGLLLWTLLYAVLYVGQFPGHFWFLWSWILELQTASAMPPPCMQNSRVSPIPTPLWGTLSQVKADTASTQGFLHPLIFWLSVSMATVCLVSWRGPSLLSAWLNAWTPLFLRGEIKFTGGSAYRNENHWPQWTRTWHVWIKTNYNSIKFSWPEPVLAVWT